MNSPRDGRPGAQQQKCLGLPPARNPPTLSRRNPFRPQPPRWRSPMGENAQYGLGENMLPDLHSGIGNFTVSIALPPGRNGFQPQLNLVHSTGHRDGYLGLGWSLSIPGMMRTTSKGIPRYRDYDKDVSKWDTFVLSGAEDLVPVEDRSLDPLKATRFRPRPEGLVPKIIHRHEAQAGATCWEECSKEGLISYE